MGSSSKDSTKDISECVVSLCKTVENFKAYPIQALYLNNCKLKDCETVKIIDSIIQSGNYILHKLYFNQNGLKNQTAFKIAEMLDENVFKVKEIGLKWNQITAVGGNRIARSLASNEVLKVLDLSWNLIGFSNDL